MKKLNYKLVSGIIIFIALCVGISIKVFASSSQPYKVVHPDSAYARGPYNENLSPQYVDNSQVDKNSLLSEEQIFREVNEYAVKPYTYKIESAVLKTWKQHCNEEDDNNSTIYSIDPNRMVWVVRVNYPDGVMTKTGLYSSAVMTITYDAASGNPFESAISGKFSGEKQGRWRK